MKKYILFFVLFCLAGHLVQAQDVQPSYIKDAYQKGFVIKSKDTLYYQRLAFKAIPSNFEAFKKLYGWDDKSKLGQPLSYVPKDYFIKTFNSKAYSREEVIKKIIGISINAEPYPAAIGKFQEDAFNFALAHNAEFLKILKTHSQAEIVSVWKFYFNYVNYIYRKGIYDKLVAKTQSNDASMVAAITAGYKEAKAKWGR